MTKRKRASVTLESAFVLPLLLLIFGSFLQLFFYVHDKNALQSMANEIAAVGEKNAEEYAPILAKRLLLFSKVEVEIERQEDRVDVVCSARRKPWSLRVESSMSVTEPEASIRKKRNLQEEIIP